MNSSRNYKLAITGAFGALTVVLGITRLGFISISPTVSYTILQVPVILAAILGGLFSGMATGLVFGVMSLIMAAISPAGALDPLFVNPLVSIVPRVMIGVVAWAVYNGLSKIRVPKPVAGIIAAYLGTFTNTLLVFAALFILYFDQISEAVKGIGYWAVVLAHVPSGAVEGSIGAVLAAAVISSLIFSGKGKSKLNQNEGESDKK